MNTITRRLAACVAVVLILLTLGGPLMAGRVAEEAASPTAAAVTVMRVGTVVASPAPTGTTCYVRIYDGGDAQEMPYQAPYVPVAGDKVNILYTTVGATGTGIVIGGKAGQSGNLVANGDFHAHPQPTLATLLPPFLWERFVGSGTPAGVSTVFSEQRPQMLIGGFTAAASDTYAVSAAFPVTPGEVLAFDAALQASVVPASVTVDLRVGWMIGPRDAWAQADSVSLIDTDNDTVPFSSWLTGTATVPAGVAWARVAVRANFVGGGSGFTVTIGAVEAHR